MHAQPRIRTHANKAGISKDAHKAKTKHHLIGVYSSNTSFVMRKCLTPLSPLLSGGLFNAHLHDIRANNQIEFNGPIA